MDYFAHGIWSYIIFHRIKKVYLAIIFGLLPDTISWAIYAFYRMIISEEFGRPVLEQIPQWVFTLYNISHSLIVCGFVIIVIYLILKRVPIYVFAWPISIVFDIFTHTRYFLPTPFLWPLSEWKFPGISWGNAKFMLFNYLVIFALLLIIYINKRARRNK